MMTWSTTWKSSCNILKTNNIINPKQIEDEKEVNNLIADILKLDLSKFKSSNQSSEQSNQIKKRSGSQSQSKDDSEQIQSVSHRRSGSEKVPQK